MPYMNENNFIFEYGLSNEIRAGFNGGDYEMKCMRKLYGEQRVGGGWEV